MIAISTQLWGPRMAIELNFIRIGRHLFEPSFKLCASAAGPRMGDDDIATINISHDSEWSEELLLNAQKNNDHPLKSRHWYTVTSLSGAISMDSELFCYTDYFGEFGFEGPAFKIEQALGDIANDQGYEIIYQIYKACVDLNSWDQMTHERIFDDKGGLIWAQPRKKIQFLLEHRLAQQLAENSSYEFEDEGYEYVLFAEREVRS
jgi:hypothetical protein